MAFSLDPDAVEQVTSDPNLQLLSTPSISLEYLAMHTQEDPGGPLANPDVRRAISHAIDYDGIINDLLKGAAVRPPTVVPLPLPGSEEVQDLALATDLARAQELFDAAGVGEIELSLSFRAEGAGAGSWRRPWRRRSSRIFSRSTASRSSSTRWMPTSGSTTIAPASFR